MMLGARGLGQALDLASAAGIIGSREQISSLMQRDIAAERAKLERRIDDLRARERQYIAEFERRVEQIRSYYESLRGVMF